MLPVRGSTGNMFAAQILTCDFQVLYPRKKTGYTCNSNSSEAETGFYELPSQSLFIGCHQVPLRDSFKNLKQINKDKGRQCSNEGY